MADVHSNLMVLKVVRYNYCSKDILTLEEFDKWKLEITTDLVVRKDYIAKGSTYWKT